MFRFLDTQVSLAPTHVRKLVGPSVVTLSDYQSQLSEKWKVKGERWKAKSEKRKVKKLKFCLIGHIGKSEKRKVKKRKA